MRLKHRGAAALPGTLNERELFLHTPPGEPPLLYAGPTGGGAPVAVGVPVEVPGAPTQVATKAALDATSPIDGTLTIVQVDESRSGEVMALYKRVAGAWVYQGTGLASAASVRNVIGTDSRQTGDRRILTGILRPDGAGGWYLIDDANHDTKGILSVAVTGGLLRITYPTAVTVLGSAITPDETFARNGFTVGASVGLSQTDILFLHAGASGLIQSSGGTWTIATASKSRLNSIAFSSGTGNITINHEVVGVLALPLLQALPYTHGEAYAVNTGFGQGSTTVRRINTSTGATITGAPPDGLGFIFQRTATRPAPADPASLNTPIGNIWVTLVLQY